MMMMTMTGDHHGRSAPTVQIPAWDPLDDPAAAAAASGRGGPYSPYSPTAGYGGNAGAGAGAECRYDLSALRRYLPSNVEEEEVEEEDGGGTGEDGVLGCDEFRMYEFKVRKCARGRSHDWTECPYAHPGEKARRRDPRRFLYSGTACPDFRKGACKKGDSCEFAHGVFECWLHPERYRTQACKDGQSCRRRVCFFAHSPDQLRILPTTQHQHQQQQQQQHSPRSAADSEFGSPVRPSAAAAAAFDSYFTKPWSASFVSSSPTSILTSTSPSISPPTNSPPVSPNHRGCCGSPGSVSELVACMRSMQIAKMKMSPRGQKGGSLFGSPLRPGCYLAAPSTPRAESSPRYGQLGGGLFDLWEAHHRRCEEEPPMERVQSGRDLRAKMYAKLSKENSLDGADLLGSGSGPDVGWVSELVM
ncbi:zinc finger CCCH domain-containing protein 2-like [Syzygium oleosum]|uniref:zinc finger CCCH domain-containing protein 2-like n=1 Tax=Syzygium oleosum TaxID=219896 RepID=UPI0011D28316|nr:zinc finger CCCH domain-containing protein 2-like [Syzygium oleosum]